jgi:hypothetical protein
VYYFPGQVGQGKIKWEDAAAHALLRDKVLGDWPKDEAGWSKTLSREDEAAYVGGLIAEEKHAVSGLGGSQKAEVAWLDRHGIPYKEMDVLDFIDEVPTVAPKKKPSTKNRQTATQVYPIHEEGDDETTEVASLVELTAAEATSSEGTSDSTSLEKVLKEETAVQDDGHEYEHKQDTKLVREQQEGQGQGNPTQEDCSKGASASQEEQQQLSDFFWKRLLAAATNDQEL